MKDNSFMRRYNDLTAIIIPRLVTYLVIFAILFIPFKILSYGFFPRDDALRHVAKAISGKDWSEIVVLRSGFKMDTHPGWHAILRAILKLTKWDGYTLVLFSVVALFALYALIPAFLLKRPEAWSLALLTIGVANPSLIYRILTGRPYIVTMAVILMLSFLWPRLKGKNTRYGYAISIIALITLSTWVHCSWYIFALPVIAFLAAGERRICLIILGCVIIGVMIGSILTGAPVLFLRQTLQHLVLAFTDSKLPCTLAGEFQPFSGDSYVLIAVIFMLAWRSMRKTRKPKIANDPIFMLAVSGWVLGFLSRRVWVDIGVPAISIWMAGEFQEFFEEKVEFSSWQRLFITIVLIGTMYIAITGDVESRWSDVRPARYLSLENKDLKGWLPEAGGIVYSDTMQIFYEMFFRNPRAPWRYMVGFEPGWMPPEDLAVYRELQMTNKAVSAFKPWVDKMKPQDRLIVRFVQWNPACIPGLEWRYVSDQTWIGRLRKKDE